MTRWIPKKLLQAQGYFNGEGRTWLESTYARVVHYIASKFIWVKRVCPHRQRETLDCGGANVGGWRGARRAGKILLEALTHCRQQHENEGTGVTWIFLLINLSICIIS